TGDSHTAPLVDFPHRRLKVADLSQKDPAFSHTAGCSVLRGRYVAGVTEAQGVDSARHGAFGQDRFGMAAEKAARFFGTPQYILGQTVAVILWVTFNAVALIGHWDPYPFILLNLAFSTQAAYAAPLILLAQTRQAERDRVAADTMEAHREEVARKGVHHAE